MVKERKVLGRGMDALLKPERIIPVDRLLNAGLVDGEGGISVRQIPLDRIVVNPDQPRRTFDPATIDELAQSMRTSGVLQPIVVEPLESGDYRVIAGERRVRAARLIELEKMPALIRPVTEEERLELALIENVQREDLNPLEEATAYENILNTLRISQGDLSKRIGKSRSAIANTLRLLKLPSPVQQAINEGLLTAGHARALLMINDTDQQQRLFQRICDEGLSVRSAESLADELRKKKEDEMTSDHQPAQPQSPDEKSTDVEPFLAALTERMIDKLGTRVQVRQRGEGGQITIDYFSSDDLQRLCEIWDIQL